MGFPSCIGFRLYKTGTAPEEMPLYFCSSCFSDLLFYDLLALLCQIGDAKTRGLIMRKKVLGDMLGGEIDTAESQVMKRRF